jgi:hypothetical protein
MVTGSVEWIWQPRKYSGGLMLYPTHFSMHDFSTTTHLAPKSLTDSLMAQTNTK